jgi:hypothetical protein
MDPVLTPDQQAGRLASLQHGAITHSQAIAAGLTRDEIRHRLRTGRFERVVRGTYVVAGTPRGWRQNAMVGCLSGPPGTLVSHLSAAALLGVGEPPEVPHVTVPRGVSGRIEVAVVHWSDVAAEDTDVVDGIPVTGPARTVVDCAGILDEEALCELVDDVLCERRCRPKDVVSAMERAGRRRSGFAALEEALAVWDDGAFPGSRAEMRLVRRLRRWGFPKPERQVKIFDTSGRFVAKVDVGWRDSKAGLEYYGERHHGPRAKHHDEHRLARVEATGWQIRVVTKADLNGTKALALREWLTDHLNLAACSGSIPR